MKLIWSQRSRRDLVKIGRYISQDNREAAKHWVKRLRNRAQQAAEYPYSGRMLPESFQSEVREILLGNYRIIYRIENDFIVVMTIFEGHQQLPEDFIDEELSKP